MRGLARYRPAQIASSSAGEESSLDRRTPFGTVHGRSGLSADTIAVDLGSTPKREKACVRLSRRSRGSPRRSLDKLGTVQREPRRGRQRCRWSQAEADGTVPRGLLQIRGILEAERLREAHDVLADVLAPPRELLAVWKDARRDGRTMLLRDDPWRSREVVEA